METFVINVPEKKSALVMQLLKELGVSIEPKSRAMALADEINKTIKPGKKLTMSEIVAENKAVR